MKKLLKKKDLIILLVLIVILISLIPFYILKIRDIIYSNKFATYSYETYTNYTNPIFSIEKIVYYSNAFVTDNSSDGNFQNINIGQYTDIAIYINNTNASDELTDKNTIAELYIDNIKVTSNSNKGTKTLCYKNPYYFATYKGLQEPENGRINFNIITNNKDNKESAYIRLVQPTTEGDLVIYDIKYDKDNDKIILVTDSTRDKFAADNDRIISLHEYEKIGTYRYNNGNLFWVVYNGDINDETFNTDNTFILTVVN